MIGRVFPEAYDAVGRKVLRPFGRRRGLHPTFPMGRYLSQPLTVHCNSLEEVRQFLCRCKAVGDEEQFGKGDYWQPPEEFEKTRKGDCDCFALWTWRQLLEMGSDARVVFGKYGRYDVAHAWVEYFETGSCFLVEPQAAMVGIVLPRISTLGYRPQFSIAWDGEKVSYYRHAEDTTGLGFWRTLALVPEWMAVWVKFWLRNGTKIPWLLWRTASTIRHSLHLKRRY
jgi:hypothetical protein